jgi:hypothetical protein
MMDRKAFQISGIIFLAMIAATVWRLSLFQDWRHIPNGPGAHHSVSGLFLFAWPASLLMQMAVPLLQWRTWPKETLPSWRRWNGKWIVSWSVLFALLQAFTLAHSLGLVSLSAWAWSRAGLVYIGINFMMMGNITPKAPSRPHRNSFELDPWRQNRMQRFVGKLLFGVGLSFALGGFLLPLELWKPVFFCLMVAALAAGVWYSIKLRHEPRDKALQDAR